MATSVLRPFWFQIIGDRPRGCPHTQLTLVIECMFSFNAQKCIVIVLFLFELL